MLIFENKRDISEVRPRLENNNDISDDVNDNNVIKNDNNNKYNNDGIKNDNNDNI